MALSKSSGAFKNNNNGNNNYKNDKNVLRFPQFNAMITYSIYIKLFST